MRDSFASGECTKHSSLVQITAALVNNWQKQFLFRIMIKVRDTFNVVYLPLHSDLNSNLHWWPVTCVLYLPLCFPMMACWNSLLLLRRFVFRKVEASDWWWTARDHGKAKSRSLSPSRLPLRAHFHRQRERSLGTRQLLKCIPTECGQRQVLVSFWNFCSHLLFTCYFAWRDPIMREKLISVRLKMADFLFTGQKEISVLTGITLRVVR